MPVAPAFHSTDTAAITPRLSRNDKLRKVLHIFRVDSLPDSTANKRPLISLVYKYIDMFAENDSHVKTTSLAFHEIDTADTHPLRQPARHLPNGEVRQAVVNEIK